MSYTEGNYFDFVGFLFLPTKFFFASAQKKNHTKTDTEKRKNTDSQVGCYDNGDRDR